MPADATCAICGAPLGEVRLVIRTPDRFERSVGVEEVGYERSWVACTCCDAVTDRLPPRSVERLRELATSYYEADLASDAIADKFARVMSLPPGASDNAQRVERVRDFLRGWRRERVPGRPLRVLDIGAGTGVFLARFAERSTAEGDAVDAVALEPDPIAFEHLRSLGVARVIPAIFSGQPDLVGFDLCTLNKVVEHVSDPLRLLRDVAGALDPRDGLAYVEVPDRLTLEHRPPGDNILGALHHHLYGPVSLALLVERAGLATLRVDRFVEPSGKITVAAFACAPSAIALRASETSNRVR